MSRILVVDDDATILRTLRINLKARGYDVVAVSSGRDALAEAADGAPGLVVLDLGLPDIDGVEVLRRIRQSTRVPVIVLSARHSSDDKVEALDEGADDYITKPFGVDELMARIRAALRRSGREVSEAPEFVTEHVVINFSDTVATRDGKPLHLTPTEWRLLAELARAEGRVVAHATLLRAAWGPSYRHELNYLRVFANQIRRKIEDDPGRPRHFITEPGMGYRLVR
jgi:two-component system, OmpR family, KDP operon response regulator KdpE